MYPRSKLQREASGINTSLMKLWRCLDQLRRNQQQAAAASSATASSSNEQLVRVGWDASGGKGHPPINKTIYRHKSPPNTCRSVHML